MRDTRGGCAALAWLMGPSLALGCSLGSERLDSAPTGVSGPGFGSGSPGSGSGSQTPQACKDFTLEADLATARADVIIAVDTSGSMVEESAFVQQQLNAFSAQIGAVDVDLRVIMLGDVCVAAPLGSGSCPDDQRLPDYAHPPGVVGSTNALSVIVDRFASYGAHLRADARKHVVIITDDNAAAPYIDDGATFIDTFTALQPGSVADFTAHAVYCFTAGGACWNPGSVYQHLVNLTGGIHGDLALQDFGPIFDVLAEKIVTDGAPLPCVITVPKPPDDKVLDVASVQVSFVDESYNVHALPPMESASSCTLASGGWFFDDPDAPTSIRLCPASCDLVTTSAGGQLRVSLACEDLPSPG
ncbi:MAG: VWA domain-containing protein [Deltaproteobacteria bacterium]|nr:VWA domain-containing protein [Deltaproteobacteria bacterium]